MRVSAINLSDLIGAGNGRPERAPEPLTPLQAEARAEYLQELRVRFLEHHSFRPGDLVAWKAGMANRTILERGEPAIVMDVLEAPVASSKDDSGSIYFREPLDLVLGILHDDNSFQIVHVDSRRFRPWSPEPAPTREEPDDQEGVPCGS